MLFWSEQGAPVCDRATAAAAAAARRRDRERWAMELVRMSFACEKGIPLEDVKKKGSGFPAYKDRVNCGHEGKILSCMPLQFEIDGVVLKGTDLSDKEVTLSFQDRKAGNEAVRKAREEGKTERADLDAAREVRAPARAWSRSGRVAGRPAGHGACCGVRGGLCRRCDAVVPSFFLVAARPHKPMGSAAVPDGPHTAAERRPCRATR